VGETAPTAGEDRRLWSATASGLSAFVGELARRGVPSTSARYVQQVLKANNVYPARDFAHLCHPLPPDIFVTYHSSQNYVDVQELVWQTGDFAVKLLLERRPDLIGENLEPLIRHGIRFWIDFLFIDQNSRNIRNELDALPVLLGGAQAHVVLGDQPLSRAWCCYELAEFNRRVATEGGQTLRSFIAPTSTPYFNWESTQTSDAADKTFIENSIRSGFPGGFAAFESIMHHASLSAVVSFTEKKGLYPPAALESLAVAAEGWYERMRSEAAADRP
jgi:hypothetical protein